MPPKTDATPAALDAAAAYFRDACDGPDGAAEACDRAARIVAAVQDPAFRTLMGSLGEMRHGSIPDDQFAALCNFLVAIRPGGGAG